MPRLTPHELRMEEDPDEEFYENLDLDGEEEWELGEDSDFWDWYDETDAEYEAMMEEHVVLAPVSILDTIRNTRELLEKLGFGTTPKTIPWEDSRYEDYTGSDGKVYRVHYIKSTGKDCWGSK